MASKVQFQPRNMKFELLPEREADVVVFDGFESVEFRRFKSDGLWSIAEASTGLPIVRGCDSGRHAYERAEYELKRHGLKATQDAIASTLLNIAIKDSAAA